MKKTRLLLLALLITATGTWAQVVSTASVITVCAGASTVDIPVKVSAFDSVGSISLKFSYINTEISSPSVVYKDAGIITWGTFLANTGTPGTIIISAYDPNVMPPVSGLTLADNTILFTLRFTIGTISNTANLNFAENSQGTACEYGGIGPAYTPFIDIPPNTYYINGGVTVVPDPIAPGLTKSPSDATVCAGQNLTVTTSSGSGGTGTITDEYRYSNDNGGTWSDWSTSVPSFAAVTGTDKIQSRRTATGNGCDESVYNEVSWAVVADPVAPGITKSPADATVCAGQALTVTTSSGSGGTGTIAEEYRYYNGSSWSSWSVSVPSFAAVVGTNNIQSRRTATGAGCNESAYNEVSWTIVADPVAPGLTKSPADASVCAGQTLTVTISSGSGGTGTITDEYRYTTNNGASWSSWSITVPSFAAVTGTSRVQSRRTATGNDCNESTYNEVSWTVEPDPVAPGLTKNPSDPTVCAGQNLTVTTSTGSGGAGTVTDEYCYSTDNGTNWSSWSVSVPSFAAIIGTNKIQSRRTATGADCNESVHNEVSWTVVADPVAPGLTKSPSDATVCAGQALTVTTSAGSGGTGTIADEYRYYNGSSWSSWSTLAPSFAAVTGTNRIQSRRTATGTGCDESSYNEVSWIVVADPVAPGLTKNPPDASACDGQTLTVTTSPGSGGTGSSLDEYRYSTNNGADWSSWSETAPSFAAVPGTNKIQSRRTSIGTGCDESPYNEVSWTVNAKQKISGNFKYHNFSQDIPLKDDITVKLYKSSDPDHSELLGTVQTNISGYYEFTGICPECDYDIVATSTHSTDGAVNTTDAAQANYWGPYPYSIEKVTFHAGDVVGPNRTINGTDAGRIQLHFVYGNTFDCDPWTFWRAGLSILHNPLVDEPEYTEYYPKVNLPVGYDASANMYGLVSGDFNRSFNPDVTKASSASLELIHTGNLQLGAGQEFNLPVIMVDAATVGALSLILDFPTDLAEIMDVSVNFGGQLDWAVKGKELRIGWLSNVPACLTSGSELLNIRLKTTTAFTPGKSIVIGLAADPLNELADETYNVIGHSVISTDIIDATALGIGENIAGKTLAMSCHPNPFKNYTMINYTLPFEGKAILEINSIMGFRVTTLVSETQQAGNYQVKFDTYGLNAGMYTATLRLRSAHDEMVRTIKLINNK